MGRPLKKKFFGSANEPGLQISFNSIWLDGMEEAADPANFYIVRQVGTSKYQVTDGNLTGIVRLVADEATEEGTAVIKVKVDEETEESVRVILSRKVKTFEGNVYKWSTNPDLEAGVVSLFMDGEFVEPVDEEEEEETPPAPTVTGHRIEPATATLEVGATQQFQLYAIYDNETEELVEDAEWEVDDEAVLTIDEAGLATAVAAGEALVGAAGVEATATVTVTAIDDGNEGDDDGIEE